MPSEISIDSIIAKRKELWERDHSLDQDERFVNQVADYILRTKSIAEELEKKPYKLIEMCMFIVDKKKSTVPFFLNEVQQEFIRIYEEYGTNKPYFILKGRQQGFTSLITAMQLSYAVIRKNFAGFTLADTADNTRAIFNDKARVPYNRLPMSLHPTEKYNSVTELYFDKLNSSWRVSTASNEVGRSRTLSFVHFSEVAFFQCSLASLQKSIGEACTQDAVRIYESTANGYNEAKGLWDSGACFNLFFEWWKTSEYVSTEYEYLDKANNDGWLADRVRLLEHKGLTKEQICWYCRKYDSYLDKTTIRQEYPCTPEEAFVSSGRSIFDMEKLTNRMAEVDGVKFKTGQFEYEKVSSPIRSDRGQIIDYEWKITNIRFVERVDGMITIHQEPRVNQDSNGRVIGLCPYAIGGDTAGTGIDYFTAKVIDNMNGNTVATLRVQHIDEDSYAEQMYCLGKYYHGALIGIEINYSRQPMRLLQMKYCYPNLYMREHIDTITDKVEKSAGFETTSKSKPVILAELVEAFRENPSIECDMETLKEMSVFVKHDNGRMAAIEGCHDDLVMALAIAHHCGGQQTHTWKEVIQDDFKEIKAVIEKEFKNDYSSDSDTSFMEW